MKKVKLLGLLVACGGVVASFAAAVALYVKPADETGFGIGSAEWHGQSGTITYKINGATSGTATPHYLDVDGHNGGEGLGGDYRQIEYSFPLSATYGAGLIKQDYVMGNFSVSLTNINSAIRNKSKVWIDVDGYIGGDEEHPENDTYGYTNFRVISDNVALSAESYSVDKDIAVASDGGHTARVYIKLDSAISGEDLLALAEQKVCDISVEWKGPQVWDLAHVVGDLTSFNEDEAYTMAPNINKKTNEGLEWYFKGFTGFSEAKCRKGSTWSSGYEDEQHEWHDNNELDSSKTYNVYWNGSEQSVASFSEVQ